MRPDSRGRVLLVDERAVRTTMTRARALVAVRAAFTAMAQRTALMPEEIPLRTDAGGELHIKGGHAGGSRWLGFKVATWFPGNSTIGLSPNSGFSFLLDSRTGTLAALVFDGGLLTDLRTAAAGALAADLMARPDASEAAVLGAGAQARSQIAALLEVRPVRRVRIWSRDSRRAAVCAAELAAAHSVEVLVSSTPETAVRGAAIVVTATATQTPLLEASWLAPGTHVTAVGADRPEKQELQVEVLRAAGTIAADQVSLCARVGEIHHAVAAGVIEVARARELADIVAGTVPGRRSPDEITVADLCGLGIEDAVIASHLLERALADGAGRWLETAESP